MFGVLGSGNFVVTDALRAGGARFTRARHESGAVGMADGFARITGAIGVASVHQGPGLTNCLTPLAEAVKCQTPMLVLSGDTAAAAKSSNFRIDQHGLVESVGAGVERIYGRETAFADATRALGRARRERRPIVLMLPVDIQQLPLETDCRRPAAGSHGVLRSVPAPEAFERAANLVTDGSRPVIIAGRGAVLSDAGRDLERLGDRIGALLATSAMSKGLFFGSPWELGICGGFAAPVAADAIRGADVIIAFGASLNHWTTRHHALLAPGVRIIQVDDRAEAIGRNTHVDAPLLGDAAAAAAGLDAELARREHLGTGYRTAPLGCTRWAQLPYEDATGDGRIDPRTLTLALNRELPADCNVVVDSGHFAGWPAMYLDVQDPRRWAFCNGFQAVGLRARRSHWRGCRRSIARHRRGRRRRRPVHGPARTRQRGPARRAGRGAGLRRRRVRCRGSPLRPQGLCPRHSPIPRDRPRGRRRAARRPGPAGPLSEDLEGLGAPSTG